MSTVGADRPPRVPPAPGPAVAVRKDNGPKSAAIIQAKQSTEQAAVPKKAIAVKVAAPVPESAAARSKVTAPIPVNLYTLKTEKRDTKRID